MCPAVRIASGGRRSLWARFATERSSWFIQEITMINEKTIVLPPSSGTTSLARLGRILVFFATSGFIYPNVFVENMDATKYDAQFAVKTTKV
jgi:hypothetical protein